MIVVYRISIVDTLAKICPISVITMVIGLIIEVSVF